MGDSNEMKESKQIVMDNCTPRSTLKKILAVSLKDTHGKTFLNTSNERGQTWEICNSHILLKALNHYKQAIGILSMWLLILTQ